MENLVITFTSGWQLIFEGFETLETRKLIRENKSGIYSSVLYFDFSSSPSIAGGEFDFIIV